MTMIRIFSVEVLLLIKKRPLPTPPKMAEVSAEEKAGVK